MNPVHFKVLVPLRYLWNGLRLRLQIRFTVDSRALKSGRAGQFNLAHGTETKSKEKQKLSSSEVLLS